MVAVATVPAMVSFPGVPVKSAIGLAVQLLEAPARQRGPAGRQSSSGIGNSGREHAALSHRHGHSFATPTLEKSTITPPDAAQCRARPVSERGGA